MNRDLWLAAVAEACTPVLQDDPTAITTREFAELLGCNISTAQRKLNVMESAGKVERVSKRIPRRGVGPITVPAYRLIES